MKRSLSILFVLTVFIISISASQTSKKTKAPNFSLQTKDGEIIELENLRGRVVLINFWATWCPPCRAEIPDFIEVYNSYKSKGFEIIGIALDGEGWVKVAPYMKEAKINYPVVLGSENIVRQYGGFNSIPTSFIIDKKGYVAGVQTGYLPKEDLIKKLKSLLK
ncbi:MAG: TlpA family protein disulfide reductase [Bacteroidetes bacterium]|nr:TlpA family protein disulfide reductase [Bacteroidota bacterium]